MWDGDYYAREIMVRLGLLETGGAVRIGFCHYHTADEVDRVLDAPGRARLRQGRASRGPSDRWSGSIAALLTGLAIVFVAVLLLLPYGGRKDPGMSYDTPYYVWRTRAVTADGIDVLTTIPTGAVPERPGVPVLGSLLGSVTGTDAMTFTVVLRAIAAVAIGLASGAMAVGALREPRWAFAAFVVGLGASAAVVGTAVGSLDQLLADVPLVAAAAAAPLVAIGRRGTLAVGVLFAAAAATHWVFAGLFLLLLAGVALALLPGSLSSRRAGAAWTGTPSGRLLRVVLVAAAAAAVTLLILPALPHRLPPAIGDRGNLLRLGAYELWLVLPLAALGFALTFRRSDGSRRTALTLLGLWAATVPVAMVVSAVLPTPIKLFRVAPFALGIPVLATLCLVTIAKGAESASAGREPSWAPWSSQVDCSGRAGRRSRRSTKRQRPPSRID